MYRASLSRFMFLKGRTGSHELGRLSISTSVATHGSSSGGLFGLLTGDRGSSLPPMDVPLKDIPQPPTLPDHVEPGKTEITTLPNGVKIVSESLQNPAASIGLYVDCGSIYETPDSFGASHLLERMAFKTTLNRSHLRVVREVEAIGGNVMASASREQMSYTYDALKTYTPEMVELLIDSVLNPAFLDWEVKEQILKVKSEISEISKNPQHLLMEAIHSAGFTGAFANALLASEATVNKINGTVLEEFVNKHYTAPRMVLAASGVDHDVLLKVAEPLFSTLSNTPRPEEPKPIYVGGDYRCNADSGISHFALAFELPGGWLNEKDAMTLTVLQILMGGGVSFSSGGPGKGMYSRLYTNVLSNYPRIQSCSAFSSVYNTTGLFGIQVTTDSGFLSQAVDVTVNELLTVASNGKVDQVQFDRAKQATRSTALMNLESRMVACEDMGRQVLTYGERKPVEHFLKSIDEVTLKDISSVAQKLLSSPLTLASYGDVLYMPSYDAVSRRFSSK